MAGGPIVGTREIVKLPWEGVARGEPQFVRMKAPVAELLGFDEATEKELTYTTKVRYRKKNADGTVGTTLEVKEVKRLRLPGYRQRSIRCEMGKNPSTGKKIKIQKIYV